MGSMDGLSQSLQRIVNRETQKLGGLNLAERRSRPTLTKILTNLCHTLAPIHPFPYGSPHPTYPKTLLTYHLLTEAQLDSLALFYHQNPASPTLITYMYPACMNWDAEFLVYLGDKEGSDARIASKRRKFGKFIGLRGCGTPVEEVEMREVWKRAKERNQVKSGDAGFYLGRTGLF